MPEREEIKAALRKAQLFSKLEGEPLEFLATHALRKTFSPGELIFSEGEPCQGLYVVAGGNIRIFKTSAGGREQTLAIDGPGNTVAELPVFDGGAYPASATALSEARLVFVSKQDFHALCLAHPQVALRVVKMVGGRLRRLVGIIEELSFTTVRQRLAALLLNLVKHGSERTERGVEFMLPANQQEIAAMIGTVRELVSRNLGRLQALDIIVIEGRRVVVPDVRRLEAELQEDE